MGNTKENQQEKGKSN
jgi:hypothetical protein